MLNATKTRDNESVRDQLKKVESQPSRGSNDNDKLARCSHQREPHRDSRFPINYQETHSDGGCCSRWKRALEWERETTTTTTADHSRTTTTSKCGHIKWPAVNCASWAIAILLMCARIVLGHNNNNKKLFLFYVLFFWRSYVIFIFHFFCVAYKLFHTRHRVRACKKSKQASGAR